MSIVALLIAVFGYFVLSFVYKGAEKRRGWRKYYKSATWKAQRKKAFAMQGRICAVCGTDQDLQVHHLRYWKWGFPIQGREHPKKDLRILCGMHHRRGYYPDWRIRLDRFLYRITHRTV